MATCDASAAAAAHHGHQDMMGGMGEEDKLTYMDLDDKVSVSNLSENVGVEVQWIGGIKDYRSGMVFCAISKQDGRASFPVLVCLRQPACMQTAKAELQLKHEVMPTQISSL